MTEIIAPSEAIPAVAPAATVPPTPAKPIAAKRSVRKPSDTETAVVAAPDAAPLSQTANHHDKELKVKKSKLVRDSFTIPKDEYVVLDLLKQRTAQLGHPAKKSELLRAGIKLLSGLSDPALKKAMGAVPAIKTGRPRSEKSAEVTEKTTAKSGKK